MPEPPAAVNLASPIVAVYFDLFGFAGRNQLVDKRRESIVLAWTGESVYFCPDAHFSQLGSIRGT
jgi:hypothetical protein